MIFIKGMRNRGPGGQKSPAGSRGGAPVGVWLGAKWISANDVSRSSPIDDRRYVFSRLRVETERCGVAVVADKVASTCSRIVIRFV